MAKVFPKMTKCTFHRWADSSASDLVFFLETDVNPKIQVWAFWLDSQSWRALHSPHQYNQREDLRLPMVCSQNFCLLHWTPKDGTDHYLTMTLSGSGFFCWWPGLVFSYVSEPPQSSPGSNTKFNFMKSLIFYILFAFGRYCRYLVFCSRAKSSNCGDIAIVMDRLWFGDWFILMQVVWNLLREILLIQFSQLCKNMDPVVFHELVLDLKEKMDPVEWVQMVTIELKSAICRSASSYPTMEKAFSKMRTAPRAAHVTPWPLTSLVCSSSLEIRLLHSLFVRTCYE